MALNLLENIGIITNKRPLSRKLCMLANIHIQNMNVEQINQNGEKEECNRYFSESMQEYDNPTDDVSIRWINTGYTDQNNMPLWISMSKTKDGTWKGGRVGTEHTLYQYEKETRSQMKSAELAQQPDSLTIDNQDTMTSPDNLENVSITDSQRKEFTFPSEESKVLNEKNSTLLKKGDVPVQDKPENATTLFSKKNDNTMENPSSAGMDSNENTSTEMTDSSHERITFENTPPAEEVEPETDNVPTEPEDIVIPETPYRETYHQPEIMEVDVTAYNISNALDSGHIRIEESAVMDIDNSVLVKENSWRTTQHNLDAFKYFIDSICSYAYTNRDDDCILSNEQGDFIINSGIMDKFGHDIYVCFHVSETNGEMVIDNYNTVSNKNSLLSKGFSEKDVRKILPAITVWKDISEITLLQHAQLSDFELSDRDTLFQIMDKKEALLNTLDFPFTPYAVASRIEEAVHFALLINRRDMGYIRPAYDKATNEIHFMIPFRINASIDEEAELVLEIRHNQGFFTLHDIITPEEAYVKAKVISPYRTSL